MRQRSDSRLSRLSSFVRQAVSATDPVGGCPVLDALELRFDRQPLFEARVAASAAQLRGKADSLRFRAAVTASANRSARACLSAVTASLNRCSASYAVWNSNNLGMSSAAAPAF